MVYINHAGAQAPAQHLRFIMKKEKEEKERIKKEYAPKGSRSQQTMSFRLDLELQEWLNQQPNKGRYINELIRSDMMAKKK